VYEPATCEHDGVTYLPGANRCDGSVLRWCYQGAWLDAADAPVGQRCWCERFPEDGTVHGVCE
jgi:hypothetical protein